MNKHNLDQALAALADALKSNHDELKIDAKQIVKELPWRSLSGDHIIGGKILKFSSAGITDLASKEQIKIDDNKVSIDSLEVKSLKGNLDVEHAITAESITVDVLTVKELKADIKIEKDTSITFNGTNKGLLWTGEGYTKQFVYHKTPSRFFSSEVINLAKNQHYEINGAKVLDSESLGPGVVKSNLRQVGRLKGLTVDGDFSINNYLFFNSEVDRLGLGIDNPHAAFGVAEAGVEVMIGTATGRGGIIGTHANHALNLVTSNIDRISIDANGNVVIGNKNSSPVTVTIRGTLGIDVAIPDQRVKLDVGGSIKFNNALHISSDQAPSSGMFNQGDIVWNSHPEQRKYIGWVCVRSGSPGLWAPFGEIK